MNQAQFAFKISDMIQLLGRRVSFLAEYELNPTKC
jgi:hypothetical protein